MEPNFHDLHIDILEVETRARKLRAEAMRNGVRSLGRWVAAPFHREDAVKL